jgi:DNA invertase Pin-like site-specific DNA recombinase
VEVHQTMIYLPVQQEVVDQVGELQEERSLLLEDIQEQVVMVEELRELEHQDKDTMDLLERILGILVEVVAQVGQVQQTQQMVVLEFYTLL